MSRPGGTRTVRPPGPAERVRRRLANVAGPERATEMPSGYQRLGRVLLLRLPESLRPFYPWIGGAWQEELGVSTVLVRAGPVDGELRRPSVEVVAGTETETEVVEHGVRWRFDAARILFAQGNRTERRRAGELVRPGESVVDLFAGIGYFAIPAARSSPETRVLAVEKNPESFRYLEENLRRNGVADRVDARLGDNREVPVAPGSADRLFLGYLPSAVPWIPRALELARPSGAWLHVHTVADAHTARTSAEQGVVDAIRTRGGELLEPVRSRVVKPYGPGREHVVVDVHVRPTPGRPA